MNRIKELRISRGMNQNQLAEALGIAQPTLSGWETGRSQIDYDNLFKLADYFGVSLDYLFGHDIPDNEPEVVYPSEEIKRLAELFDKLSPSDQEVILRVASTMAAKE